MGWIGSAIGAGLGGGIGSIFGKAGEGANAGHTVGGWLPFRRGGQVGSAAMGRMTREGVGGFPACMRKGGVARKKKIQRVRKAKK